MTDSPLPQEPRPRRRGAGKPFQAGQSGNPAGRPKGTRNLAYAALDSMAADGLQEIVRNLIRQAQDGDVRAAELLLRRTWPERKGRLIEFDLPDTSSTGGLSDAVSALVRAVSEGRLTPDEAQQVAAVIEIQRRTIETNDHDVRLQRLEEDRKHG